MRQVLGRGRGAPASFDGVLAVHGYERVEQDRDPDPLDDGYETLRGFLRVRRAEL